LERSAIATELDDDAEAEAPTANKLASGCGACLQHFSTLA